MVRPKNVNAEPESPQGDAAYARYASALRGYLARRLRTPTEAADLAQETFARYLRKKDRPEVARNPLAFLFGIAANVFREHVEAQRTSLVHFDSELADGTADAVAPEQPDPLADQMGLQRDLSRALRTLPPNHLAAVLLVKGEGLSIAEAARQTGFTEGTVAVYLCEARWKLKKVLQDYARREENES
jgi:RNA polymerase sigma-70 factor, ECF subfamily